jgi:hypothetical protein
VWVNQQGRNFGWMSGGNKVMLYWTCVRPSHVLATMYAHAQRSCHEFVQRKIALQTARMHMSSLINKYRLPHSPVALLNISRFTVCAGNSDNTPGLDNSINACFNCFGVRVFGLPGVGALTNSTSPGGGKNAETQRGRAAWATE